MLMTRPFVEKTEYGYAVARIRALETKLLDETGLNTLLSARDDGFVSTFTEITGIGSAKGTIEVLLVELEESFSVTFNLICSLVLEDEMKRLLRLKYDYEILKIILKEEMAPEMHTPVSLLELSNYGYGALKTLLAEGRATQTGEVLFRTYNEVKGLREAGGVEIDTACDRAYYEEVFSLLEQCPNEFIKSYFIFEIDTRNIVMCMRIKVRGMKRSEIRSRYIPLGTIDVEHLEDGLDLNPEGFSSRIVFSPLAGVLREAEKTADEEETVVGIERLCEDALTRYLRESRFVTFGLEPLFAYLRMKEIELANLRTVFMGKISGIPVQEIRKYMRSIYG